MKQADVMDVVIQRLYFGKRPPSSEMATNGSILKKLNKKHTWATLALVVEGLALRRDRGELKSVGRHEPVSLRWLNDKDQMLNQVPVCQDAVYKAWSPASDKRGGAAISITDILKKVG